MAKKKYLEESERKLIESVNNAYIPTDWDEFEKRYHEMERYGDGEPRKVDKEKMEYIEDGLVSRGVGGNQLSSLLSTIVEESGGNPFSVDDSGKFRGLIQFSKERYPEKDFSRDKKAGWEKAVDNQLDAIVDHLNEYGGDYGFLDGGDGSGYMTGEEAKDAFWGRDSDIENVTRALTYGFVRPGDRSGTTENRTRVARLINEIIQPPVETPDILEFDYDGKHYKATKPEEVTPEMRRALMLSKLVGEKNKVELQDPLYTTFDEAYGRAKGKGASVFMWKGKKYSTKEDGGEVREKESSSFLDVLKKSFRARTATANLVKDIFFGSEDGKPTELNRSLFSGVDPRGEVPNWSLPGIARAIDYAWDTLAAYIEGNYKDGLSEEYKDLPIADRVAINAWAKYNHLPYDKKLIIDNGDGTFRLPKEITGKIRTDKKQIERIYNTNKSLLEKAEKKYSNQIEQAKKNNELEKIPYISEQILSDPEIELFKGALEMDKQNLAAMDSLNKNGKAVFNEFNYSGRNLRNEEDLPLLNVMGNHTIERDQNGNYRYKDIYDFWPWFDWMTRGNIFKIEGKVPHRKDGGRGASWTKGNEEDPEAHFYDTYKSTEMKEEGGETNAAEFSLPEVNIYPNNRFGDIARSQGLKTARQWMEVRNATTNGINDFVNDPRTQFVLGMLPLPMGVEGVGEISNLIKKAKDFRQISKDLRITPWMEQQLIDDAVEKANWRILEDEGALGQGRLITQQDRPSVELTLKPKSQKNSGEYAGGRKFINNKLWWSHRKPFYWGATRDDSKRILYSIDGNNVDLVRAKDLDPEYPNSWVYLTDEVVLADPKLNTKFFVPTEGGYFIPSSHYRFTQWKDDMVDMMNTVKPEEWAEFRDGGWTEEDENDFQKWYAKIAEYKGLNPDPDDAEQYYDYRTYWLENPEAAQKMLENDPEAHFSDRYKYPGHPTFSDESMYADEEHPGGHWETVDGVGYYVPSEYTKSYIDRTIQYLAGQNEGVYIDGEYKLIPKMPDGGLTDQIGFLAKKYWDGFGKYGKGDIESGVFDERRWVVKRIGDEEFYTNSPLLKTLPSMSREDVALSRLPLKFWPGIIKRRGDKTGVAARKHFLNGGETSELQDYIYDRLTQKHGIPPIQAIGIVANLTQESALNYDALGDNGRSYGIQQWQGDRRKKLFEFAKERGREEPALDDQVDFLVEEYKDNGFLFPTRGENMYKTGKTDKDMFDYFQYSKLDFDNASNIYDSTRAWAQGFGRGNKNFLNMDKRFHIAKTLSSRYNIDAGGQSFYTDMGYKDEWGSPVPEVAVSAEKKAAQDDWMEKYGNKMLASILAGDGEGGDTHVTNNYYVNEEGLSEDEKRNAAEVQELQQKQQAQELLASIIDGIKLDIKGVTEVRKR